jgi:hypothetical protein
MSSTIDHQHTSQIGQEPGSPDSVSKVKAVSLWDKYLKLRQTILDSMGSYKYATTAGLVYLAICLLTKKLVGKNTKPWRGLSIGHNVRMSLMSIVLTYGLGRGLYKFWSQGKNLLDDGHELYEGESGNWIRIFSFTKLIEMMDTPLRFMTGEGTAFVKLYQCWHHMNQPLLMAAEINGKYAPAVPGMLLNVISHCLAYGITAARITWGSGAQTPAQKRFWKFVGQFNIVLQMLQFIVTFGLVWRQAYKRGIKKEER